LNTVEGLCWGVFGDHNDLDDGIGAAVRDNYEKTLTEFWYDCNDDDQMNEKNFKNLFGKCRNNGKPYGDI